jgi:uncharacterized DUF497 family protein
MTIIYRTISDLARIEGFDLDAGNRRKNPDRRAVSQAEAEQIFLNEPRLMLTAHRHNADEPRLYALGRSDEGRRLQVTFALRGEGRLICEISARDMHRKERARYAQTA